MLRVEDQRKRHLLAVFGHVVEMLDAEVLTGRLWVVDEFGVRIRGAEETE